MLTDNIEPIIYNGVATIGGNYLIPKGIGKVICSCNYDEEQLNTKKLNNLLYSIESQVKKNKCNCTG